MKLQKHITNIFATLGVISLTAMSYAAIDSATSGGTLTATMWNNMKSAVDGNTSNIATNTSDITSLSGSVASNTNNRLETEAFTSWLANKDDFTTPTTNTLLNLEYTSVQQNSDSNIFEMASDGTLTIKKAGVVTITANFDVIRATSYSYMYINLNGAPVTKTLAGGVGEWQQVEGNIKRKVNANDQFTFQSNPAYIDNMNNGSWSTLSVQWTGIK